jgi:HlyD family secretion protein
VWQLVNGAPAPVRVKIGITDGSFTEITGGELAEGAAIITGIAGAAGASQQQQQQRPNRRNRFL